MTAVSFEYFENVYFDVLDRIVDKYNSAYHRTIKMKPVDVKSDSFAEYNEESNEKGPRFKVGFQYKNVFTKGYTPNWLEKFLWLKGLKKQSRGHTLLVT